MTLPCTFRGMVDWASHRKTGVLVYLLTLGFLVASVIGWFVWACWLPVWEAGLRVFPEEARIQKAQLIHPKPIAAEMSGNQFLSIGIRTQASLEYASTADVRLILDPQGLRIGSLMGYVTLPYHPRYIIDLNPSVIQPWWFSRSFLIYLGGWVGIWGGMIAIWWTLAGLYTLPVFFLAYLWGRQCSFGAAFRLSQLSLMPPALFMSAALVLYGLGRLTLQEYLVSTLIHIPMAWLILILSVPHFSHRILPDKGGETNSTPPENPFHDEKPKTEKPSKNPFQQQS